MRQLIAMLFLVALAAFAMPTPCSATSYTVTDLGTLGGTTSYGLGINASAEVTGYGYVPPFIKPGSNRAFIYQYGRLFALGTLGGQDSHGYGINDGGQVTGDSEYSVGMLTHAFLYDGTMHDLGSLSPYGGSNGRGINGTGQVTGSTNTPSLGVHAFLWTPTTPNGTSGTMHDLGTLGGTDYSYGLGINASGQVTGYCSTIGTTATHAFLYDGTMHDLGTLGGNQSQGLGINASGQVVGYSSTASGSVHAFLYSGGVMQDLGTLGGQSEGLGINASGQVTGWSGSHAFLWDAIHGMVDLNSLISPSSGWVLSQGNAINDLGQITGYGSIGGQTHAFLLTPLVPEPSSIALAALGFTGLAAWGWRRRKRFPIAH